MSRRHPKLLLLKPEELAPRPPRPHSVPTARPLHLPGLVQPRQQREGPLSPGDLLLQEGWRQVGAPWGRCSSQWPSLPPASALTPPPLVCSPHIGPALTVGLGAGG
ncbi:hypothetical protein VULLAG_LOCUS14164 [Vulpes lagopus]